MNWWGIGFIVGLSVFAIGAFIYSERVVKDFSSGHPLDPYTRTRDYKAITIIENDAPYDWSNDT